MTRGTRGRVAVFGPFRFNLTSRELEKGGIRISLEDKPARILAYLILNAGVVVTREELREVLWPTDVHVDYEHGINSSINKIRSALNDDSPRRKYVETLSRRGYRFVGPVEILEAAETDTGSTDRENPTAVPVMASPQSAWWHRSVASRLSMAVSILLLIAMSVVLRSSLHTAERGKGRATRSVIEIPNGLRPVTTGSFGGPVVISPDGRVLVFRATRDGSAALLWIRELGSFDTVPLPGTENARFPFWSPDGRQLAFFADGKLKRMNLASRQIDEICDAEEPRGGSWGMGDVILFAPESKGPIMRVSVNGGRVTPVTNLDDSFTTNRWPEFLPDGKHFVYLAANHDPESHVRPKLFLGDLGGESAHFLAEADSNADFQDGKLFFLSGRNLLSQTIDQASGKLSSDVSIVASDVEYDPGTWHGTFAVASGVIVYRPQSRITGSQLAWFDEKGKLLQKIATPGPYMDVAVSPADQTIAARYGEPDQNVWLINRDETRTRVTETPINYRPVWSPDGSRIAYGAHRDANQYGFYIKETRGGPEKLMLTSPLAIDATSWSADGRKILLLRNRLGTNISAIDVYDVTDGKVQTYLTAKDVILDAQFSPNGHFVAYSVLEQGEPQIYLAGFPSSGKPMRVTPDGGGVPRWRPDGNAIYYLSTDKTLFCVDVRNHGPVEMVNRHALFKTSVLLEAWAVGGMAVDESGSRFLLSVDANTEPTQFVLVTN